jgi:hypothetical protein
MIKYCCQPQSRYILRVVRLSRRVCNCSSFAIYLVRPVVVSCVVVAALLFKAAPLFTNYKGTHRIDSVHITSYHQLVVEEIINVLLLIIQYYLSLLF